MSDDQQLIPFLMFQDGRAEEAMDFYVELFGGEVLAIDRYGTEMPMMSGKVRLASFAIGGIRVNIIDSSIQHGFDFTPSMSLYYTASAESELYLLWESLLAGGGSALMPKDDYGFGPFGWLNDRYGVSWQLTLAEAGAD